MTEEEEIASAVAEEVSVARKAAGDDGSVPAGDEPAPHAEPSKPDAVRHKEPRVPLPSSLQEIVGALLFASESPLTATELRTCVRGVAPEDGEDAEVMSVYQSCTSREIEQALHGLGKELERSGCGFRLVCTGGTYRLQTVPSCGRYVRAMLKLDRPNRLSRAALETLAIIAYRQPITKAEIEQIRGVAVDAIVKSLVDLQLVRLVGRSELPGHPFLYGTSPMFLEHFGLSSLSELNEIDPTLQRSNPRERAKLFVKEKKSEEKPVEQESKPAGETDAEPAEEKPSEPVNETGEKADAGEETVMRQRVAFRPDEDEDEDDSSVGDTPDEFDEDDDEPLTDDDDSDDDEPLTDDDDFDDDADDDDEEEEDEDDE